MLAKADTLLSFAEQDTKNERTFAACAALVLAATLDQGTYGVLEHTANVQGNSQEEPPANTRCGALLRESFRKRVIGLKKAVCCMDFDVCE